MILFIRKTLSKPTCEVIVPIRKTWSDDNRVLGRILLATLGVTSIEGAVSHEDKEEDRNDIK